MPIPYMKYGPPPAESARQPETRLGGKTLCTIPNP